MVPTAWATFVLLRSWASTTKLPEGRLLGTVSVTWVKVPLLSACAKVEARVLPVACRLSTRSMVALASNPLPITLKLVPWRTTPGLSRMSGPTRLVDVPFTLGVLVGSGVLLGSGVVLGCGVACGEPMPASFSSSETADELSAPTTTTRTTSAPSTVTSSFPRFLRPLGGLGDESPGAGRPLPGSPSTCGFRLGVAVLG